MLRNEIGRRIMAGTLGLACLLAAATSQARVLVNGISVCCITQNERGEDEIFLKFNGVRVNVGNFSNGVCRGTTNTAIVSSLPVVHELWEDDGNHWYDGDDQWYSASVPDYASYGIEHSRFGDADWGQNHWYQYYFTLSSTP